MELGWPVLIIAVIGIALGYVLGDYFDNTD